MFSLFLLLCSFSIRSAYSEIQSTRIFDIKTDKIVPYYFSGGITVHEMRNRLRESGTHPLAIIPGGFHSNLFTKREPVDFLEIAGREIIPRMTLWPIFFFSFNGGSLGVAQTIFELPRRREFAIATGPWIRLVNISGQKILAEVRGNATASNFWFSVLFDRSSSGAIEERKTVMIRKNWNYNHKRIAFDKTKRGAISFGHDGRFVVLTGTGNVKDIAIKSIELKMGNAVMFDGGSSFSDNAKNPVYIVIQGR